MTVSTSKEPKKRPIKRVGIVFSGGPAPAANAVISTVALTFMHAGKSVVGFLDGYAHLINYNEETQPLTEDLHYRIFKRSEVTGLRNQPGVCIRTSRTNPGNNIHCLQDLDDPANCERLARVIAGFKSLEVDALISIGGDGTLRTANILLEYQDRYVPEDERINIVHLPKTIDNDYRGIDFTFGYFTAVDVLAREVRNIRADAEATGSYFIVEVMGRQPGWLAYGVGIAGEANLIVSAEDIYGELASEEDYVDPSSGDHTARIRLNMTGLAERIVRLMLHRQKTRGLSYGVIVLAEGLAERLPEVYLEGIARNAYGHISLGQLDIGKLLAKKVAERYRARTGNERKVKGLQLGYESRCAPPTAFDVVLACSIGAGAFRALVEEGLTGHMVTISGQMEVRYIPFRDIIVGDTLQTEVRFIERDSDFYRLARSLEDMVNP